MRPKYKHSVKSDEFVQNMEVDGVEYDVYRYVTPTNGPYWLARYSDVYGGYNGAAWSTLKELDTSLSPVLLALKKVAQEYEGRRDNDD